MHGMSAAWDSASHEATDALTPEANRASTARRIGAHGKWTSGGDAPISPLRALQASASDTRALKWSADTEPGTAPTGALSMCAPLSLRVGRGVSRPATTGLWWGSPFAHFMIGCRNGVSLMRVYLAHFGEYLGLVLVLRLNAELAVATPRKCSLPFLPCARTAQKREPFPPDVPFLYLGI